MIRRPDLESFLLISQHEHALLAARLARELGNANVQPPSPLGPTLEAIALHDSGWPLHDDRPTLNPAGLPLHVFEVPIEIAVRVWSESARRAAESGTYQGLLVSLHVLGLAALFMAHAKDLSRHDLFEVNKFQHKQIEHQEALRARLGLATDVPLHLGLAPLGTSPADDQLLFNFRLLTAMDRVSLALCCGKDLFPTIHDLHPRPGAKPEPVTITMPDPSAMTLAPWPFRADEVVAEVPARRVRSQPYTDPEVFRRDYENAAAERVVFTIRRG